MTSRDKRAVAIALAILGVVAGVALFDTVSLSVAALVLVVLTVFAAVSPLSGLLAVVVTLPYFYMPLTFGSHQFAASEVLLIASVSGLIARVVFDLFARRTDLSQVAALTSGVFRSPLSAILIVLTAVGLALLLASPEVVATGAGLREWRWTMLLPLAFVISLPVVARGQSARMMLAIALIAAGMIAAVHGFLDIVTDGGVVADNIRRLSGPFPHPNALALFLVRPLVLATAMLVIVPRLRIPLALPAIVLAVATFGTFSRGAMIAVLAAALLLGRETPGKIRYVLAGTLTVFAGVAMMIAGDRMRSALDGGSVSLRLDIWNSAARLIRDSPVLGYGPDQFLYVYAPRYILPTAWDERFTSHAHNLVADSWLRLGIVGALTAAVVLVIVSVHVARNPSPKHSRDVIRRSALVALAAVLVHGMIDNAYFAHDLAMSAWLLAWLAFSVDYEPCADYYEP